MKKTILYYGGFALPDCNAAAHRVVTVGKVFAELGYDVAYLGVQYTDTFSGIRSVASMTNAFEIAHPTSIAEWLDWYGSIKYLIEASKKFENLAMVVLYNMPLAAVRVAKRYFADKNVMLVYDCTEWSEETSGNLIKRCMKKMDCNGIIRHLAKSVDGMIVISSRMKAHYSGLPVLQLPPMADLSEPIWQQRQQKKNGEFVFCFAGTLGGSKESLNCALDAFGQLDDRTAVFELIGLSREDYKRTYPEQEKLVDALGSRVRFLGRLSHTQTMEKVLNCNCYIFIRPDSQRNNVGFPTKFMEAYTCGVPIITTDVSDISKYIKKSGQGIVLQSTEPVVIAQAMQKMLQEASAHTAFSLNNEFYYKNYLQESEAWLKELFVEEET